MKKRGVGRPGGRFARTIGPGDTIPGALLLAALLEAQGARADGIDASAILAKLSDLSTLTAEEVGLLHLAIAIEAPDLLTAAELAAVLDPQTLLDLGLPLDLVADLLDDSPELALQRLKEAFGPKLKAALASAERKAFGDEPHLIKVSAQAGASADARADGSAATAGAAAGAAEAGMSPLALLAGIAGLGAIGVAVGSGGGGSSGNSPANVNDAPTTTADTIAATEDTPVTFDVRTNDRDADGDPLTVTAINGTAITATTPVTLANVGTISLNASGTLTFTPLPNYNGAPSFTYTVSDGRGGTATGTATVTVAAVNDAPVNSVPAATLAASAGVGVAVAGISVADVDGGSLTTTLALGSGQGTLAVGAVAGGATIVGSGTASVTISGSIAQVNASLGAVTYTSGAGFSGTATLTVTTSDGTATDVDTRSIAVARVQTGVVSDGYVAGASVFIDVNGNGIRDALGPGLELEPQTTTNANGTYSFASNLVGPIVATGGTNIDTGLPNLVTLTAPVGSTVINPLTTIVQSLVSTGVPAAQATMQVAVALGLPATTNLGSYDILAQPATDPVAVAAQKVATQIVTLLNTAREAAGSTNAAAVETAVVTKLASAVTAAVTSSGESTSGGTASGSLNLTSTATLTAVLSNVEGIAASAVTSAVTKTASINQTIQKATDLGAITTSVLATTGPNVNLAPAAADESLSVADIGDDILTLDLLTNDLDPEGDALSVTSLRFDGEDYTLLAGDLLFLEGSGIVVGIEDGVVSVRKGDLTEFVLGADPLVLTYVVTDARGAASTGTLTIDFGTAPVNRSPVAVTDTVAANEDTPVTFDVRANDSDADGNPLGVTAINGSAITLASPVAIANAGTVSLNANGTLTFTPLANFNGTPSFSYTVSDGFGGAATGTVNIAVAAVNDAPVARTDAVTTAEDSPVTFNPRANDSDADGNPLTITAINGTAISLTAPVTLAGAGTISLNANGTLSFTPLPNFNGARNFTYTVSDGFGGTATSSVSLNVTAVNDAPLAAADVVAATEDTPAAFDVRSNDSDADGDTLTVTAIDGTAISVGSPVTLAGAGSVALNANGTLTFTPLANFNGTRAVSYTVSDGKGGTATGNVALNVAAVNDAPVASADTIAATEDLPVTFDVRANDSDAEGDALAVTAINGTPISTSSPVTLAGIGTIALNANGTLTFTPLPDFNGAPSFAYTLSDGRGGTATGTATLNVAAVGDVLTVAAADFATVVIDNAAGLAAQGIIAIDVDGPGAIGALTLTDGEASKLIDAGINLVEEDGATLVVATSLSNNLQSLQALGIDSVEVAGGLTAISLESGSLSALVPSSLPQFDVEQSDGAVDVTLDIPGTTSGAPASLFAGVADTAGLIAGLGGAGIDHIDLSGSGTVAATQISGAQAQQLVAAGIDFADNDSVTVAATQLSTSLQSLQTLGVDSVAIVGGATAISLDAGSIAALSPTGLPQFDVAQSDGALDVTLNVIPGAPGNMFAGVADPVALVTALGDAGIDHIDISGPGTVGATTINQAQAGALIDAGIDFADADTVTLSTAATHLANNLQALQALGVDSVAASGGLTAIDVDAGSLAALSPGGLPQFDIAQSDAALDVTLNVYADSAMFGGVADSVALIAALGAAGVDHININGESTGIARISDAEAGALVAAGIDFDPAEATIVTAGTQLATSLGDLQALGVDSVDVDEGVSALTVQVGDGGLAALDGAPVPQFDVAQGDAALDVTLVVDAADPVLLDSVDFLAVAGTLGDAGIDYLDIGGAGFAGSFELSDAEAEALVATGLAFAANDDISMAAAGTHLSTSLHDLQKLGVDSIDANGAATLRVELGAGIDGLAALPQFDVAQSDAALDVTLSLPSEVDLGAMLGIELLAGLTTPELYGDLIDALIAAGIDRIDIAGNGTVLLRDGLADVLTAIEGFTADDAQIVLNAEGAGDVLRTSLHDMADLGVDQVRVDDQGTDPVYVHFGDGPLDETTLLGMLDSLDSDNDDSTPLFTGSAEVALVVDQATAEAIAQASGALDRLAELGFTEITILDGVDNSFIGMLESGPLEVKLIGQDDDLYDHLNP